MHVHRLADFQRHEIQPQHVANGLGRGPAEFGEDFGLGRARPGQFVEGVFGPAYPGHGGPVVQGHGHPGLGRPVADDVMRRRILGQTAQRLHHGGFAGVVGPGQDVDAGGQIENGIGMGHKARKGQSGDHGTARDSLPTRQGLPQRQTDPEFGALSRGGGEADGAAEIAFGQQFGAVGPKAPALALGGKGALEHAGTHGLGQHGDVAHPKRHRHGLHIAAQGHRFPRTGGLQGIFHQIAEHPTQQHRIAQNRRRGRAASGLDALIGSQGPIPESAGHHGQQVVDIQRDALGFQFVGFGGKQLALTADLLDKLLRDPMHELRILAQRPRHLLDQQRHQPLDPAGGIEHVVKKDTLQGAASLFMADVGDGKNEEPLPFQGDRRG